MVKPVPAVDTDDASATTRSPGRPTISLDRILATALQIVDEDGAEALSMRTLAQRLGSGTATLYRHFDNRAHLVARVVDRVLGQVEIDPADLAGLEWQEACLKAGRATFDAIGKHGNIAPLLAEQVPVGPNAMAHREQVIAMLLNNGFAPRLAALAYATLARTVLGYAMQLRQGDATKDAGDGQLSARFRSLSRTDFPATWAVAEHLPVPLEEEFMFGMKLILAGLEQLRQATEQLPFPGGKTF